MISCKKCGKTVEEVPLYRGTPQGMVPVDWYCEEHLDSPPDDEVKNIMDIISGNLNAHGEH